MKEEDRFSKSIGLVYCSFEPGVCLIVPLFSAAIFLVNKAYQRVFQGFVRTREQRENEPDSGKVGNNQMLTWGRW